MLEQYASQRGRRRWRHKAVVATLQRDGNLRLNEHAYQLGQFSTPFVTLWFDREARAIEIVPAEEDGQDTFKLSSEKDAGSIKLFTSGLVDYVGWKAAELMGHYLVSPRGDGGLRVELIPSRRWEAAQEAATHATKARSREKREDMAPDVVPRSALATTSGVRRASAR